MGTTARVPEVMNMGKQKKRIPTMVLYPEVEEKKNLWIKKKYLLSVGIKRRM